MTFFPPNVLASMWKRDCSWCDYCLTLPDCHWTLVLDPARCGPEQKLLLETSTETPSDPSPILQACWFQEQAVAFPWAST